MIRWLDRVTGLVTMYRLILICLLVLVVEAFLVALLGQLSYNALGILVVTAVAVAISYVGNRLFALLFRVAPHSESALITGLILGLLYLPTLDPLGLFAVAVAALAASAGKYLLAVRRRHVFNPAALGAFVSGLIFPTYQATWWVGNPWLLPLVVVGAFVILFRTRHLTLGLVFVVVGAASTTGVLLSYGTGTPFATALAGTFTSTPLIFFVGFMLSEPLTLPPRRWQQLVEAVVVGVLYGAFQLSALHTSLGLSLTFNFLLALLVGNLLAFLFGQRRGIRLEFLGKRALSDTAWELEFAPRRPVRFRAGQYLELTLPHRHADVRGLRRTFSIASAPGDATVRFGIRVAERSSTFKTALLALTPGEVVTGTLIGGDFVLPSDPKRPVLLVSSGIGVTPFVSHLADLADRASDRDAVLVYASSSPVDLPYVETLRRGRATTLIVAPSEPPILPEGWRYLGAGPLTADMIVGAVPDAHTRAAYVSGAPELVRDLKPALRRAGVRSVRSDYFTGY